LAIIRWESNNPGGSPEHYGVVHYGTNAGNLSETAKSPIRLNPGHSDTIVRVSVDDLRPKTTYYYTVESMGADGTNDGVKSPLKNPTQNRRPMMFRFVDGNSAHGCYPASKSTESLTSKLFHY
jgi:hypothetical protein